MHFYITKNQKKKIHDRIRTEIKLALDPFITYVHHQLSTLPFPLVFSFSFPIFFMLYMFIAALFTTAKTGNQPSCPSTDEMIMKVFNVYKMVYYSALKKSEVKHFCRKMGELRMDSIK